MRSFRPAALLAGIVPVLVFVVVAIIDPPSALVLLVTGPVLVLLLGLIGSRVGPATAARAADLRWMQGYFADMLRGLATLRAYGRSREQVDRIREIGLRYGDATMRVLRTAFQASLVLEWGAAVAIALHRRRAEPAPDDRRDRVPADAGRARSSPPSSSCRSVAWPRTTTRAPPVARRRPGSWRSSTRRRRGRPSAPRASATRRSGARRHRARGRHRRLPGTTRAGPRGRRPRARGADGGPRSSAPRVRASRPSPGSCSGSSSPDAGRITVGGRDLATIDAAAWRSRIAYVPQAPHLFHGTVADNIRLARPDATDEQVIAGRARGRRRRPSSTTCPTATRPRSARTASDSAAASASGSPSPAPSCATPTSSSSTSPPPTSTPTRRPRSPRRSTAWAEGRTVVVITHRDSLVAGADTVIELNAGRVVR